LGLRLFVKLNTFHAVNSPKDAIDEMKGEHIEALKERISVTSNLPKVTHNSPNLEFGVDELFHSGSVGTHQSTG
jgi:hypothetical protein